MRRIGHLTVVAAFLLTVSSTTVRAGLWSHHEPLRPANSVGRCLGVGWSDGYHAVGSRNSWSWSRPHAAAPRYFRQPVAWPNEGMTPLGARDAGPHAAPQVELPSPGTFPTRRPLPLPDLD